MKKIVVYMLTALLSVSLIAAGCSEKKNLQADFTVGGNAGKSIVKAESFPDMPENYKFYDYNAAAKDLVDVIFSFTKNDEAEIPVYVSGDPSSWDPVGMWVDQSRPIEGNPLVTGYLKRKFTLPTYIGDNRFLSRGGENMTMLASVLGASYAGVDMSDFGLGETSYDMAEMTLSAYNTGTKLVSNAGVQGQSFWYDIFPQILFARLYDIYNDTQYMKEMVLNGADQWLEALPNFVKDGQVNYEFVGYDVVNEAATTTGDHIEPPNGGLAFLFYSAYRISGEEKYLDGAKEVLDYLQDYQKNPNYEALTDYAPYVAAILNREYGCDYDVGKFLDFLFEGDSAFRSGWCVMDGSFGSYAVDGLVGQSGDYAFAMNTFHLASVLACTVKYDTRYADIVGKYLLNVVNNAKVFFPQNIPLSNQSMSSYLPFDFTGSVCYEGFRNRAGGYAMGDATAMFSQPCDLSLYSSVFIGMLGGIVSETNVRGILRYDLNKTDSYGFNDNPTYLYYNPYEEDMVVEFAAEGTENYDLFDSTQGTLIGRNLSGNSRITVPAKSGVVVTVLPAFSEFTEEGTKIYVGGNVVYEYLPAVNVGLRSRQQLTSSSVIPVSFAAGKNDKVVKMRISFGDIVVYEGDPLENFSYDKSLLPDTDYTLKIEIETERGLKDYVTKRVVAF